MTRPNLLTATEALARMRAGQLSVVELAEACLERIVEREPVVRAWVTLDPELILARARELDERGPRGPLHGIPIAVKDVILTADMPTQNNSPLYKGSFPAIDAGCIKTLRAAGALIFGKTDTTEFAATTRGGTARHPLDITRTPGGSSSGSAAAVRDWHVPIGLGTQTGGSTIRPASYCGIYALKPSWGAVNREGLKMLAPTLDTLGLFARSIDDLDLLADVYGFEDRVPPQPFTLQGARIAACRTHVWPKAEAATRSAFETGVALLREAGAEVVDLDLPDRFASLSDHHTRVMHGEARSSLLCEEQAHPDLLHGEFKAMVENRKGISRVDLLEALDVAAACRPMFDTIAEEFDAILTPSTLGEAPIGGSTGDAAFNAIWTLLHAPVVNVPGLTAPSGLPIGLSLICARYRDRHLLGVARAVGATFDH